MSRQPQFRIGIYSCLLACAGFAVIQGNQSAGQNLNQEFQSALAQYKAGNLAGAAAQLEDLSPRLPKSFEVHELLGLVYAAQSQDAKALPQLETAVTLKPDSAAAKTNLGTCYFHAGKSEAAADAFRGALKIEPQNFDANHNLGEIYIQFGKIGDALSLLEQAQRINPSSYDNSYDLAQAYFSTGKLKEARQLVDTTLQQRNTSELHSLLGKIDEKDGQFVEAAKEFETAVHMEPSEDNLFDWGSELLLHRTYEPAIDVFQQATKRYPDSPRLLIGLGMALYSRGKYEDSIKALLAAADLDPTDPRCYLFLSKAYLSSPDHADDVIQRFRRYSELQPGNALAQYYYAISLWKGKRLEDSSVDFQAVESLLQQSIKLNGNLPDPHLQLGILYADQHQYDKSYPEYERALELNPELPDAHYRLGQYYVHAGQKDHAQQEFDLYQKLQAQHQAEVDKERAEVQQFVYSAKAPTSSKP